MGYFIGILLVSFIVNSLTLIPYINLLYRFKIQRQKQKTKDAFNRPTPIFDNYNQKKTGIPIGGGLLTIVNVTILFLISFPILYFFWVPITSIYNNPGSEIKILLFTFLSFGLIGLYDDINKVFLGKKNGFFGLRLIHKLALEIILSVLISFWLFSELKISIINVPFLGVIDVGIFYLIFASFVITAFANAYNITDGLDGLAAGILMIALSAFWVISHSILDTTLSLFIAIWLGGIIAFLYFNIHPARIFLGDVGALSFGATFAVIGLLLGKTFSLPVIGGLFVIEIATSLFQLLSKKYRGKKIMSVAPLHLWLQKNGWNETTIVFRAWLIGIILAILGLWLAFLS
ncbi:phospho-N-acetylmuramoyl-pentapeptide-transferase [Candidatus Microgenomates bacterium]|nr:phospho-N-acetylmuramoyl-pentapeptide-transferase [Candidatus Microgenomates bacterium]